MNWIDLDGLVNLRDTGGIPTTDGGVIRERRLLRSDNLQSLTRDDIARLRDLGLTDVIDVRSTYEVVTEGDPCGTEVTDGAGDGQGEEAGEQGRHPHVATEDRNHAGHSSALTSHRHPFRANHRACGCRRRRP